MKKIIIDNKPVIYNVEDVNRVVINLYYPAKTSKADIVNRLLLTRLLSFYNKNYKDIPSFYNELDRLYIMNYKVSLFKYLEVTYIKFTLVLPKDGIIEDYSRIDALKFFKDCIYNSVNDGKEFDKEIYNKELEFLKKSEDDFPKSLYEYSSNEYNKFVDKDELIGVSHEHYMERLEESTSKKVYDYYKKNILNNSYKVYICGCIDDEDKFKKDFNKVFNNKNDKYEINANFYNFFVPTKYEHKEEKTKYEQSALFLHYNIKDMSEKDLIIFYMLFLILTSKENDIVYNHLRVKNNLIYTSRTKFNRDFGIIDIVIYYNDFDYKKLIDMTNEIIFKLKEEDFFNYCKEKMIKASEYDLLYLEDEPFGDIFDRIECELKDDMIYKEKLEAVKNIDYKTFSSFMDKVILTKTYLFESGDKHD